MIGVYRSLQAQRSLGAHEWRPGESANPLREEVDDDAMEVHADMRKSRQPAQRRDEVYRQLLGFLTDTEDPAYRELLTFLEDVATEPTNERVKEKHPRRDGYETQDD